MRMTLTTSHALAIFIAHIVADKNSITKRSGIGIMLQTAVVVAVLASHVAAVNNGLARVPQLGWVSAQESLIQMSAC